MDTQQRFPKKQHYIPQFYLKYFSPDNEHIHVYDKEQKQFRFQTSIEVAHQNHFYTYQTKHGTKESLEDLFSIIEGDANLIIEKVLKERKISPQNKADLALFIALLYVRTPYSKKQTENMYSQMGEQLMRLQIAATPTEWLKKFLKEKEGKDFSDEEIADLIDFGVNEKRSKVVFDFPQGFWVKQVLEKAVKFAPLFTDMDWIFLISKQQHGFIISDNPFMLMPPEAYDPTRGYGLITNGSKKVIPLKPNLCLIMGNVYPNSEVIFKLEDKDFCNQLNRLQILNALRFVFTPDKGKLEKLLKDIKLPQTKKSKKMIYS